MKQRTEYITKTVKWNIIVINKLMYATKELISGMANIVIIL